MYCNSTVHGIGSKKGYLDGGNATDHLLIHPQRRRRWVVPLGKTPVSEPNYFFTPPFGPPNPWSGAAPLDMPTPKDWTCFLRRLYLGIWRGTYKTIYHIDSGISCILLYSLTATTPFGVLSQKHLKSRLLQIHRPVSIKCVKVRRCGKLPSFAFCSGSVGHEYERYSLKGISVYDSHLLLK